MQGQNAVPTYFTSEQILHCAFTELCSDRGITLHSTMPEDIVDSLGRHPRSWPKAAPPFITSKPDTAMNRAEQAVSSISFLVYYIWRAL